MIADHFLLVNETPIEKLDPTAWGVLASRVCGAAP
jgi:hypothetical protein